MSENQAAAQAKPPGTTQLLIRPYIETDWPALCQVHDAARLQELAASVGVAAFQPLAEVGVAEGLFDGVVAVGIVQQQLIGFVAWTPAELTWLYVDPAWQRQGHGRTLLRHAIALAEAELWTEVLVGNDGALALYRDEGFAIAERREGHLSGNPAFPAAAYRMQRARPIS